MKTIITWIHGENIVSLRRYNSEGMLVNEEIYKDIRFLDVRVPTTIPSTLLSNIRVYIVAGDVKAEKRNSILIIK